MINLPMILHIVSYILKLEAVFLAVPWAISAVLGESCAGAILLSAGICAGVGIALGLIKPKSRVIYAREGFVVVALSWIVLSLFGALPFWFSGEIPSLVDAWFETVSGFTTTGASILTDVEALSYGLLFWRSFTHWIGGMGVLVFVLAVLPSLASDRSMHLMRAEVPGPSVGKLVPKMRDTAKLLYGIYLALTIIEIILLLTVAKMPLFDSVVHSFGTAGTGGFSIKNASIGFYDSAAADGIIGVFMLLFGINFNLYYLLLLGNVRQVLQSDELRCYLGIVAAAVGVITLNILPLFSNFAKSFRFAFFQVSSIITTTGYATADFDAWPELSRCILVLLMFFGCCGGSTGGGIKTARIIILFRSIKREISRMLHPRAVGVVRLDGKVLDEPTIAGTQTFFVTYMGLCAASVLLIAFDGFDFATTFTAMVACLNNIGPGLGLVGPTGNFSMFSDPVKLVLSFDMLLGRLEIFPMLTLLAPSIWRRH